MRQDLFDRALVEIAPRLPAYFQRRVSDVEAAEDLAQETLLKAVRGRAALRDAGRVEAWIYGIAHRTLVDHYRQRSLRVRSCDAYLHEQATERSAVQAVLIASARCYLETLPGAYRDPVHLAEYEGYDHHEVAERLGLSLAATKSRVRRGKLMVRELMEAACEFEYDALGNIIGYRVRCVPAESCK